MQSSGLAAGDIVSGGEPEEAVRKKIFSFPMYLTFKR